MTTEAQRNEAFHALQEAAERLIAPGVGRGARSTSQWMALQLIGWVGVMFTLNERTDGDDLVRLRGALNGLMPEKGIQWIRAQCVRDLATGGDAWRALPANDAAGRARVLLDTAMRLSTWDSGDAFAALCEGTNAVPMTADLTWLSERLAAYDPKPAGRKGAKSAERILAEIIVEELDADGAFELSVALDEDPEEAVERIRKILARDVTKFSEAVKAAENMP